MRLAQEASQTKGVWEGRKMHFLLDRVVERSKIVKIEENLKLGKRESARYLAIEEDLGLWHDIVVAYHTILDIGSGDPITQEIATAFRDFIHEHKAVLKKASDKQTRLDEFGAIGRKIDYSEQISDEELEFFIMAVKDFYKKVEKIIPLYTRTTFIETELINNEEWLKKFEKDPKCPPERKELFKHSRDLLLEAQQRLNDDKFVAERQEEQEKKKEEKKDS